MLAALVWWSIQRPVANPGRIASVAVLPLDHMSGIPDEEYFTEGMHEAVISELGKVATLRVISRTTMLRYRGTEKSVPEIARELDVDAVVEGSVLRIGDQVRITAQLIRASSDEHMWADSYERNMRDVLELQAEVANAIANQIEGQLTPPQVARRGPERAVDPEAYEAYLKGRHLMRLATPDNRKHGAAYFEQAIALDPSYAPAYAGLADALT
jgi:TolB-like protein